jgi:MinD-like ATPase involved in chromosome partitioning or flagellar assembly
VIVDAGFCIETDEELSYDTAAPRRNAVTLSALERADVVVAVGSADPLGLTRLTRGIHEVRDRVPDLDLRVVVNRMRDSLGWSEDQIAETIGRFAGPTPIGFLPDDRTAVDRAWVDGTTLSEGRDSALRQAIGELTTALLGTRRRRQRRFARRRG